MHSCDVNLILVVHFFNRVDCEVACLCEIAKSFDIIISLLFSFTQISVIFEFVVIAYKYNLACLVVPLYDLVRFVVKCDPLL